MSKQHKSGLEQQVQPANRPNQHDFSAESASLPLLGVVQRHKAPQPLALPDSRLRQRNILSIQRHLGNRHVQRLMKGRSSTIQRQQMTLIVDDDAPVLQAGQMRKREFLAQLRAAVCEATDAELVGTIYSTVGCPYINRLFPRLQSKSATYIERGIRRWVPDTATATTATDYFVPITARVRVGVRRWLDTGSVTGVPDEFVGASSDAEQPPSDQINRQIDPETLGNGQALDTGVRRKMEHLWGHSLADVTIHTDAQAAQLVQAERARAVTIGNHVAFGAGQYRPGTLVGDALLAHEMAHVVQQRGATARQNGNTNALERDANRSMVGMVMGMWGKMGEFGRNMLPTLRSGIALRRCDSCNETEPSLIQQMQEYEEADNLAYALHTLTEQQLNELHREAPANSMVAEGVRWERAFRAKSWSKIAKLHRDGSHTFYSGYGTPLVELIMKGETTITVTSNDTDFTEWVESNFTQLVEGTIGFRLIIELLAEGKSVNIAPSTSAKDQNTADATDKTADSLTTEREVDRIDPETGETLYDNEPLPVSQQRRGRGSGTNIRFDIAALENRVVLGQNDQGQRELIETNNVPTFAHELIHALHNARGENIAPPARTDLVRTLAATQGIRSTYGQVRDPVTGEGTSAEELRTITGQHTFQAPSDQQPSNVNWATDFNVQDDGITENAIRAEHNLPMRTSHVGATRAYRVRVTGGETFEQMLARYHMKNGSPIPAHVMTALRSRLSEMTNIRPGQPVPQGVTWPLEFPHGQYIGLYLQHIQGRPRSEAEQALDLRVRGAI